MNPPPVAFLDADVLFSAALGGRVFGTILELGRAGIVRLVTSEACVREAFENLRRKRPEAPTSLNGVLSDVEAFEMRQLDEDWATPLVGSPDAHVLAAARALGARWLVTGDRTHFGSLMGRADTPIGVVTPRGFLIRGPEIDPS